MKPGGNGRLCQWQPSRRSKAATRQPGCLKHRKQEQFKDFENGPCAHFTRTSCYQSRSKIQADRIRPWLRCGSVHLDFNAAVARLVHAVFSGHEQLALATAHGLDAGSGKAFGDDVFPQAAGAVERKLVIGSQ